MCLRISKWTKFSHKKKTKTKFIRHEYLRANCDKKNHNVRFFHVLWCTCFTSLHQHFSTGIIICCSLSQVGILVLSFEVVPTPSIDFPLVSCSAKTTKMDPKTQNTPYMMKTPWRSIISNRPGNIFEATNEQTPSEQVIIATPKVRI